MVPWLTFRGLRTDHLEGFSADHRLTFRGLPAECLLDLSHEAAARSRLVATNGALLSWPQEVLSRARPGLSNPRDLAMGVVASFFPILDLCKNRAAMARGFFGTFWAAGGRTVVVHFLVLVPIAGNASFLPSTGLGESLFR